MTVIDPIWRYVPIASGRLYEGARWLPDAAVFQWVDILAGTLHRWAPEHPVVESRDLGLEFATVALPLDAHRSLVASRSSLHEYNWSTGSKQFVGSWDFDDDIRFNDGAVAPDGSIYVGTMSMTGRRAAGVLYLLKGEEIVPVVEGVGISNGLAWLTESTALYADSLVPAIDLLDFSHSPVRRERFLSLGAGLEPDGLTVDSGLGVLVALWRSGRLARCTTTGDRLDDLAVPGAFPTSVAVGGRDANLLLVTTAAHSEPGVCRRAGDGHVFVTDRRDV